MNAHLEFIRSQAARLLAEMPAGVTLEAAVKKRNPEEVAAAYEGGIRVFGHNYVQEAQQMLASVYFNAEWHLIGHLQSNKAVTAVQLFNLLETIDSYKLALRLESVCSAAGKTMPVLIEVNSGREENKTGVMPEEVEVLAQKIAELPHLSLKGLMTMGPLSSEERDSRPYFKTTRQIFEILSHSSLGQGRMSVLSMGMSGSYRAALDEGANLIRLGTAIFGARKSENPSMGK